MATSLQHSSARTSRRAFTLGMAAAWAAIALPAAAQKPQRFLADMHSHYGMFRPRLPGFDMHMHMLETGATLLAWSITDDNRWIGDGPRGLMQLSQPKPGELWSNFQSRLARYQAMLDKWGLKKALAPADVDAALAGEPRILLATESANFLEGDASRVVQAHAWGIRHMQLVHYIDSPLGDHQTVAPKVGGMTAAGREVIEQCRQQGIVVDLAHCTPAFVDQAIDASNAAFVWSHSWISQQEHPFPAPGYMARALPLAQARKLAARGGTIGLWTVRVKGDPLYTVRSVRTFADEVMRMCDLVGPAHVAFGTDMEGAGPGPILSDYADLREVADNLAKRGLPEATLQGIFIGNYARVVKTAMAGATTSSPGGANTQGKS